MISNGTTFSSNFLFSSLVFYFFWRIDVLLLADLTCDTKLTYTISVECKNWIWKIHSTPKLVHAEEVIIAFDLRFIANLYLLKLMLNCHSNTCAHSTWIRNVFQYFFFSLRITEFISGYSRGNLCFRLFSYSKMEVLMTIIIHIFWFFLCVLSTCDCWLHKAYGWHYVLCECARW